MIARSLSVSLPRLFWRSTSCLNLVVGFGSRGGGGGGGSCSGAGVFFDLRLATSDTQVLEHRFQARIVEQVLAGLGVAQDLGGLLVHDGTLSGSRCLLGLGRGFGLGG